MWRRWRRRLHFWLHRRERGRLLREEMDAHLEMKAQELMDRGLTAPEARTAAQRQFGNVTRQHEEAREMWIARWWSDLVQDTAFAARTIGRQPGFAATAALSAALGIGACSLIFGIANHALFRPLPVEDPAGLMGVVGKNPRSGKTGTSITYPDFEDLRRARAFEGMTAFFQFMPATISSNGDPQRYWGSVVTANYFEVVRPAFVIGRGFDSGRDDRAGEAPVVVLSHQLWRTRFGADRDIIGRSIELNGRQVTVIGVTSAAFRGTEAMLFSDFWLPFSMLDTLSQVGMGGDRLQDRSSQWLMVAGRLRKGVDERTAASEIAGIGARLSVAYPGTNTDRQFHVERAGLVNPGLRKLTQIFFTMLIGVSILILFTACANVANLLLARASARQKEIATRMAIGGGRGRLVRQLLTESVMLAMLGGLGGYAIARLGSSAIGAARMPIAMPVDLAIALDYRVVCFCIAASAVTGVVFGLVPALRATRPDLVGGLRDEPVSFGGFRPFGLRNTLVVAQVTMCTVLLVGSGLFMRSLASARTIDTGLAHRNLLIVAFDPSQNGYTIDATRPLVDAILERARALPGVESASLTSSVPLNLEGTQNSFVPLGDAGHDERSGIRADIYAVAPHFFETFGIRMIAGEDVPAGVPAEDTVVVNQALADRAFPGRTPLGRHIRYLGRVVRITGLVATTKSRSIGEDPHPCLYFPLARNPRGNDSLTGISLVLRTRGNPAGYAPLVREAFRTIDPTLALFDVRTMDAQLSQALILPRTAALLFGFAGFMGLSIAAVGLYGVISFGVARRTREIGIRMALGARRSQVVGMVLRRGLALTVTGCAIGTALALGLSRVAASLLYGVSPTDLATFAAVPIVLLVIALAACVVPARRASSCDPVAALRCE